MSKTQEPKLCVAALQLSMSEDKEDNVARAEQMVRRAAKMGAQIVLPPELFEGHYFCRTESDRYFSWAHEFENHPTVARFQALCRELSVVVPVSFFEKSGPAYYNSVAMIDADGAVVGLYRKSHVPDGPGYEEKFYFRPGNTGFRTFKTRYGCVGVGICWDQWFPECARAMMLLGADILLYPTAIGSEPEAPELDTQPLWQRAMVGHAVSNVVPVVAANRIGNESGQVFYGSSFIANHRGDKVMELGRTEEGVALAEVDFALAERARASFGFFRDRRPDLYSVLLTEDGRPKGK